jgi:hypothetical protein
MPAQRGSSFSRSEDGGARTALLYPDEMDRYADRLDDAATNDDAAKMRPDDDEDGDDEK